MRGFIFLIAGALIGLAMGLVAPDMDFGFSVGARPAVPAGYVVQWVDRTHKANRLDVSVSRVGKQPPQHMLQGCEPAASPLSASAQVAARCAA